MGFGGRVLQGGRGYGGLLNLRQCSSGQVEAPLFWDGLDAATPPWSFLGRELSASHQPEFGGVSPLVKLQHPNPQGQEGN